MNLWKKMMSTRKREIYYYDTKHEFSSQELAYQLLCMIHEEMERRKKTRVLFLCIGTDRSTGDSLGPLIGYKLSSSRLKRCLVLGTLEEPVHAMNLEQYRRVLENQLPEFLVVAVDASVGSREHVGYITLGKGPLKPGLGVCKELQEIGDLFITGIVGSCSGQDPLMLQSIRLSIVMALADSISESICLVEKFWDRATTV